MNALAAKIGWLLGAAFFAAGVLLALAHTAVASSPSWPTLLAQTAVAALAFGLVAALCVSRLVSRRLEPLTATLQALCRDVAAATPQPAAAADAQDDEIDALSVAVRELCERTATQAQALRGLGDRQRELLANVAHDLRTPLASMQGYLELLLLRHGSLEPAEERNYLETAARQSERLGRLVGDLFELALLDAQQTLPECEAFAAAELMQDVAQKFEPDARRRRVALRAECAAAAALQVQADIRLIERVLECLVENALQHTPAGGAVTLRIDAQAGQARVVVEDTGCGMAAEALAQLFEHYERTDRRGRGRIGLRLAITQRLVRLHGSELEVCSAPGRGSRFSFALPLAGS